MRINPLMPYNNTVNNQNFTSCVKIYDPKTVTDKDIFGSNKVKTTSNVFRYDLDWNLLMKHIFWSFINKDNVNIYSFACSDGSEPYSYALYLIDKVPESYYKKFTPIQACDIDPEMIRIAKSGKINLSINDFHNMKRYIKNPDLYFKNIGMPIKISNNIFNDENAYEIDPEIRAMVKFKKSDILTELKQIEDDGNSVVNIRNVFPYLNESYGNKVLETLAQKLKSGSIFVFGNYDNRVPDFRQKLCELGFYFPIEGANFVQKF